MAYIDQMSKCAKALNSIKNANEWLSKGVLSSFYENYALKMSLKARFGFRIPMEAWPLTSFTHPRLHPALCALPGLTCMQTRVISTLPVDSCHSWPPLGVSVNSPAVKCVVLRKVSRDEGPKQALMQAPGVGQEIPGSQIWHGIWGLGSGCIQSFGPRNFSPYARQWPEGSSLAAAEGTTCANHKNTPLSTQTECFLNSTFPL